jgi:hypothetical protein
MTSSLRWTRIQEHCHSGSAHNIQRKSGFTALVGYSVITIITYDHLEAQCIQFFAQSTGRVFVQEPRLLKIPVTLTTWILITTPLLEGSTFVRTATLTEAGLFKLSNTGYFPNYISVTV